MAELSKNAGQANYEGTGRPITRPAPLFWSQETAPGSFLRGCDHAPAPIWQGWPPAASQLRLEEADPRSHTPPHVTTTGTATPSRARQRANYGHPEPERVPSPRDLLAVVVQRFRYRDISSLHSAGIRGYGELDWATQPFGKNMQARAESPRRTYSLMDN